ncbi:MAG: hypothetical protein IPK26_17240 [Planctomycetes bacterium]|nr:hypothetical protein [Planctomycetota bacterium]
MRAPTCALVLALAATVAAQGPRLVDRIDSPLVYLALDAVPARTPSAPEHIGSVRRMLADPALDRLLGFASGGDVRPAPDSATGTLALLKDLIAKTAGELELAVTGFMPVQHGDVRVQVPLLAFRARLSTAEATRMHGVLADVARARPHRRVGGTETWALAARVPSQPAGQVEVTLVDNDLVVTNSIVAMDELLLPMTTSASRRVLAGDGRFQSLRERLAAPPGSLLLFGDWPRLGNRLGALADGLGGDLLEWSGLGAASAMMAALSPGEAGLTGTMLLSFPRSAAIDGWFSAVQSVPARALSDSLPAGGLGGLVLAMDPERAAGDTGVRFRELIQDVLDDFGLDFRRQVLGRLGQIGAMQVMFAPAGGGPSRLRAAYSLRARSRAAARELFDDLVRSTEVRRVGSVMPTRDRRDPKVLRLQLHGHAHPPGDRPHGPPPGGVPDGPPPGGPGAGRPEPHADLYLSVLDDVLLFAYDPAAIAQVHEEARQGNRKNRRDAVLGTTLQAVGDGKVAGLFDLDLTPVFAAAFGGNPQDWSGIPARHLGYVDLQKDGDGFVARLRVSSSR